MTSDRPFCDGITRRSFLEVGALAGLGLSLADFLRAQSAVADTASRGETACVFIYLTGGASHQDLWDLKPDAPSEVRGEFKPIATHVPGVVISEVLPRLAGHADKLAILRSMNHGNADHGRGTHVMQTGVMPGAGDFNGPIPNNIHPSYGSVVAREKGAGSSLPPYIAMPQLLRSGGSSFLGAAYAPFVIESDPAAPQFRVRDVDLPMNLTRNRLAARRAILEQVDHFDRRVEEANRLVQAMDVFYEKAYSLITSPAAKAAFDVSQESDANRQRYSPTPLGQCCLMARRLIEAGCRFVSIANSNWDTHANNFRALRRDLAPGLDNGLSSLLEDLYDRGLLDRTLIVVAGDFGRTPQINKDTGRDHWPNVFSVVLAGAGLRTGQVVGQSDPKAAYVKDRPISPQDLAATIYQALGIDYEKHYLNSFGRPIPIVYGGKPVREVV